MTGVEVGESRRRVIVLGATSAVAEAVIRLLAAEGADLYLVGRRRDRLQAVADDARVRGAARVELSERDLTDTDDAVEALRTAKEALGSLDAVLLCYGYLGDQQTAERDAAERRRILDVNFDSAVDWVLAAAQVVEVKAPRSPAIVAVSSVAGDRGRSRNFVYGAAKGGLSILMAGLAHKCASSGGGLRVVTVKLGFVDTPMTAHIPKKGALWSTPDEVAPKILRALKSGHGIVYVPSFWRWIMFVVRAMPTFIFNRTRF